MSDDDPDEQSDDAERTGSRGEAGDDRRPDADDPLADIDVDRREGDPFESLGRPDPEEGRPEETDEDVGGKGESPEWDPFGNAGSSDAGTDTGRPEEDTAEHGRGEGEFGDVSGGGPFGEPDPRGDPFEDASGAFGDTGGLDPDEVWEQLEAAESLGSVSEREEGVYAEVSKHSYCEGCEWFSEPPDVACTHEGTEIIEFLDMETVRLLNCPVVAERRELRESE